jgi:hypothetical protein
MKVKAAPGQRCPMEHKPRSYIDDNPAGVEVAESAYYLRLIADGSLIRVALTTKKTKEG